MNSTTTTDVRIHIKIPKSAKTPKTLNMTNLVKSSKDAKSADNKAAKYKQMAAKFQEKGSKGGKGGNSGAIVEIDVAPLDLILEISDNNRSGSGQINLFYLEAAAEEYVLSYLNAKILASM